MIARFDFIFRDNIDNSIGTGNYCEFRKVYYILKAVIYERIGCMEEKNIKLPILRENELLLKVQSCGICSNDVRVFLYGSQSVKPPIILGHEITGEIVDMNYSGQEYKLGQRVVVSPTIGCGQCKFCRSGNQNYCCENKKIGSQYDGGFAEYVKIPARAVYGGNINIIPTTVNYIEASLTEPLACVINGQGNMNIGFGDTVAIIGAGPIGLLHAETARLRGAKKIILINKSSQRLETAKVFNYDAYIDLSVEDGVQAVNNITNGNGADIVIIAAGSPQAINLGINIAAHNGRVCLFSGFHNEKVKLELDFNFIHYRQIALYGAFSSAPKHHETALNLIAAKKIDAKKFITHIVTLDKIKQGIDIVKSHNCIKVIVVPNIGDLQNDIKQYNNINIIN